MNVNTGKIQKGDYVKHNRTGYCGTVDTIYDDGQVFVQWDRADVLPCKLPMIEFYKTVEVTYYGAGADPKSVTPVESEMAKVPKDTCPKCGDYYKETWIAGDAYYDCLKCNKKKEDLEAFASYGSDQATEVEFGGRTLTAEDIEDACRRAVNGNRKP